MTSDDIQEPQRPTIPIFPTLFVPELVLCALIAFRPRESQAWPTIAAATIVGLCCLGYKALSYTTGEALQDYTFGSTLATSVFTAIHLLYLTHPNVEFRHERDVGDFYDRSFVQRAYWAFCVVYNQRGIGWNYEVAHARKPARTTRWRFVWKNLIRAAYFFILVDIAEYYKSSNPLFALSGQEALSTKAQGYVLRCLNITAMMCTPYAMLNMEYALFGATVVALGVSEPKYWPKPYGNWADAYTIRRFWGRTWHQMMRRFFTSIGKFCARNLGFTPGSSGSSYTQLYIGFILSGIIHAFGDAMVGKEYMGASFFFFFAQAIAITCEDVIIAFARVLNLKANPRILRAVGYVWVFVWFSISTPWFVDWSIEAGVWKPQTFPIGPLRALAEVVGINAVQYFPMPGVVRV